jgi:hypothetical protein
MPHQRVTLIGILACAGAGIAACGSEPSRIEPVYDRISGALQLLKMDANANGRIDTWSYMDGARIVRIEVDENEDGMIDRWEHYDSNRQLSRVGISRLNDGKAARTEYYDQGVMVGADEDSDGDGTLDKWETYDAGRLAAVAFDTSRGGRPDRRLIYGADGSTRLEIADARGQFVAVNTSPGQSPSAR